MSTLKVLLFACAAHALPHSESGALPAHILKVREEKVAEAAVPEIKGVAQLSASDIADVVLHKMEEKEAGAKAAADKRRPPMTRTTPRSTSLRIASRTNSPPTSVPKAFTAVRQSETTPEFTI